MKQFKKGEEVYVIGYADRPIIVGLSEEQPPIGKRYRIKYCNEEYDITEDNIFSEDEKLDYAIVSQAIQQCKNEALLNRIIKLEERLAER